MTTIVSKFGGTSLACPQSFEQVKSIINSDSSRKYIVVSAMGKSFINDTKVTDLLYKCDVEIKQSGNCPTFSKIAAKFINLCNTLKIDIDIKKLINDVLNDIILNNSIDFTASRGEYITAKVFAKYIGYPFVDACDFIVFNNDNSFNANITNSKGKRLLSKYNNCVIGGFYGAKQNGSITTFSRGGSDITGAIVAKAANADLYENWTDVNGFRVCDPKFVSNACQIQTLSYSQLRHLSYMGSAILHSDSIFPVLECAIPINIRNTFNTANEGTMILPSINLTNNPVNGIASKSNFSIITIEKEQLSNLHLIEILKSFNSLNIKIELVSLGVDTVTLVADSKQIKFYKRQIIEQLNYLAEPELIDISSNFSLISVLINKKCSTLIINKISSAFIKNEIPIKLIDVNCDSAILIAVDDNNCAKAVQTIYKEFF